MTISSWLNFGRPAPPGRGSAAGRIFLASPYYYSQRAAFASFSGRFFHYFLVVERHLEASDGIWRTVDCGVISEVCMQYHAENLISAHFQHETLQSWNLWSERLSLHRFTKKLEIFRDVLQRKFRDIQLAGRLCMTEENLAINRDVETVIKQRNKVCWTCFYKRK